MSQGHYSFLLCNILKYLFWCCFILDTCSHFAESQILPDDSLGNDKSVVRENINLNGNNINLIDGGTTRGINLFHSFQDFNVSKDKDVYFNNPQGVQNIISRVTGSGPSSILGKLGVLGEANLFFLNPNGIVFGPHASLDLRSSFVATTADVLQFSDLGEIDSSTNTIISPLLTINPSALRFSRTNNAPITNQSTEVIGSRPNLDPSLPPGQEVLSLFGLKIPDGKSLILVGGDILLDGGGINALSGRIEIGSIQDKGTVGLSVNDNSLSLSVPQNLNRGDVLLTNGARIDASGEGGGNIKILGENIRLKSGARIVAETYGDFNGGTIDINSTNSLEIIDFVQGRNLSTLTTGLGNAGNIDITTEQLTLRNGAQVATSSLGKGIGGKLTVNASKFIDLDGINPDGYNSSLSSSADSTGRGGDIAISTKGDLILKNGAVITSNSGGIYYSADDRLVIAEGSAGDLTINADNSIQLLGGFLSVGTNGNGNAGNLEITTNRLSVKEGASIFAFTVGDKSGGNIKITASDSILISDTDSSVSAAAFYFYGIGNAGNINIETGNLYVNDNATVTVSSPQGQAGKLTIRAKNLYLDKGTLTAETGKSGANLSLNVENLLKIENESLISATANGSASGGNIEVNAPILLALFPSDPNGSDIVANAEFGRGGNIKINAQGVFGIEQRKSLDGNQTNDFDASSQFGSSGQVQINTTTDVNKGLVELPTTVLDPNTIVSQHPCDRGWNSSFALKGRGGNPPTPRQDLSAEAVQVGLVEPAPMDQKRAVMVSNQVSLAPSFTSQQNATEEKIVPAQGWVYNNKGEVLLVAYNPTLSSTQRLIQNPTCPVQ